RARRPVRADDQGCGRVAPLLQPAGEVTPWRVPALGRARHRLVGLPQVAAGHRRRGGEDERTTDRVAAPRAVHSPSGVSQRATGSGVSVLHLPHELADTPWWRAYLSLAAALAGAGET